MSLAQNFEENCKYVLGMFDVWEAFETGTVDTKAWQEFGKKLMARSLGRTLRKRENDGLVKDHVSVLNAAREARNFLAHKAAAPALYLAPMGGKHKLKQLLSETVGRVKVEAERREMVIAYVQKELPRFEKAVRDLARGDSIVSEWSYMIQEKDAHMPSVAKDYADDVAKWVLEPMQR